MKTYKLIPVLVLLLCITSCETYQQINTRINPDGSIEREVFARGDSAFMAGNTQTNPFLFQLDDNWQVTRYDSAFKRNFLGREEVINARARAHFSSVRDYSTKVRPKEEYMVPLLKPVETVDKKFRWFYTYYTYQAVYPDLAEMLPVPLDKYLNEREQLIYFQGNISALEGMNGMEQWELLDGLTTEFRTWLTRCEFEMTMDIILDELRLAGEDELIRQLSGMNDTLYGMSGYNSDNWESVNTFIAAVIDKFLGNDLFSTFYTKLGRKVEERMEKKTEVLELFLYRLNYGLQMPGKLVQANSQLRDGELIVWHLDSYRFLTHDYVLEAESRVMNVWAFMITFLLLIVGLVLLIRRYRNRF